MTSTPLYFRLRIRTADNTADALALTSVRGGTNPYLSTTPQGDGASFDPLTAASLLGAYTGRVADWSIGSAQRVLTSQLEDGTTFRQQLGYRRAILEWSYDGATWSGGTVGGVLISGYLTLLRLVNAAEFEYTVSDAMTAQVVTQLFSPTSKTNIATFLSAWPNRGCILGGPIMAPAVSGKAASVLGVQDLGGWKMKVEAASGGQYFLRPINVYGPPAWNTGKPDISEDLANTINQAIAQFQNSLNSSAQSPWTTIEDSQLNYWAWPAVTVLINSGSGFVPWKPLTFIYGGLADSNGNLLPVPLVSPVKGSAGTGLHVISDGVKTLTNGATVQVRVVTVLPTEASPIYITGHPVDLLTTFWTAAGLAFDASACAALKTAMGTDQGMAFRITEPKNLTDLVQTICAIFGLGIRGNDNGELQPFVGRKPGDTAPSVTITSADVVDGSTSLAFELDPTQAVQTVTLAHKIFADQRNVPYGTKGSVVDGIVPVDDSATFINADAAAVPFGQFDLSTDAQIQFTSSKTPTLAAFGTAIAQLIFDRFGHGAVAMETTLLRGGVGDSLRLGDECLVALPQIPNHNYRLGDNGAIAPRAMQIVRRTVLPSGYAVRLLDSGPNAQPLATAPTVTIAASSDTPRTIAIERITNAAALNALGYGARLQWATTSTGSAPAASQYADVKAWGAGQIPTGAVNLPPVAAGTTVYVRARSELASARPSAWSTVAGLTLSAISDPTALTSTPSGSDGSLAVLAWTPGSGTTADLVDIWLRLSGAAFSAATKIITLNPGSNTYTVEGLTPGTAYTASVQYRDPRTNDVSDPVDVTFTAGATTFTLPAPVLPQPFAGSLGGTGIPRADGIYGIAVVAAQVPGSVEVAIATETSVGSGTYGAFVTSATVPSIGGGWTIGSFVAPNDGLRRQLKARHVKDGTTASAYTNVVTVTPWTPLPLPGYPTALQCEVTMLAPSPSSDAGLNLRFQVTGIDPTGGTSQVEIVSLGTGLSIVSGAAAGVLAANNSIWRVVQPIPGAGPSSLVVAAVIGDRRAELTIAVPEQTTLAPPQGTVSIDANGAWSFSADAPANAQSIKWQSSNSAFPSDASVAAGPSNINTGGRAFTANSAGGFPFSGPLAFGQTVYVTIIPYTGASGAGTQLPSMHIQGSYLSFTASKTLTYPITNASPINTTPFAYVYDSNGFLEFGSMPPTSQQMFRLGLGGVPNGTAGVTLTQVAFECYGDTNGDVMNCILLRQSSNTATQIALTSSTFNAGWQTLVASLSESTVARGYHIEIDVVGAISVTGGNRYALTALTYTMSDPKQST